MSDLYVGFVVGLFTGAIGISLGIIFAMWLDKEGR
jgi:hypothetical protein